jgi:hypothetical protein
VTYVTGSRIVYQIQRVGEACVIHEHSMSIAEETFSNTFDFAHKLVRAREPQELAKPPQRANEVAKTTIQSAAEEGLSKTLRSCMKRCCTPA